MPASYCQIAAHIIFALKHRNHYMPDGMFAYIHGIISQYGGIPIRINGPRDHVHILCYIPKNMSIADLVRTVKANSSKWHNKKSTGRITWQTGYAAFGVSKNNLPAVEHYIANQEEHHTRISFRDEMEQYLCDPLGKEVIQEWFQGLPDADNGEDAMDGG